MKVAFGLQADVGRYFVARSRLLDAIDQRPL